MIENVDKEQRTTEQATKSAMPHFQWPTSKPGPKVTPPPLGLKPLPGRVEQTVGNNIMLSQK